VKASCPTWRRLPNEAEYVEGRKIAIEYRYSAIRSVSASRGNEHFSDSDHIVNAPAELVCKLPKGGGDSSY
jgi:hypothetical protein